MANFELLKIEEIEDQDLDTDIKSTSESGLVKARRRFTKIRKQFTLNITEYSTQEEVDELRALYNVNRTVGVWEFTHPTEIEGGSPKTYQVRFSKRIVIKQVGSKGNYYNISDITLEEA